MNLLQVKLNLSYVETHLADMKFEIKTINLKF